MPRNPSPVALGLLLTFHVGHVISQYSPTTTAQCSDDFKWMYNSKNQSPCLVAAYLQATCFTNGAWSVQRLDPGTLYLPPNSTQVNACQCNTVTYNMLSACAACQKQGWVGFKAWVQSCPEGVVQVQTYPFKLPSDTAVPGWGYVDTSPGTFDVKQAQQVAQNTTGEVAGNPAATEGLSAGTILAIVVGAILLIAIPLIYILLRRKPSLNPFSSHKTDATQTPIRVQPLRMKSIWIGDAHKYSPIQKPGGGGGGPRTSPVASLFSPLSRFRGGGAATAMVSSERPTSKFEIDKDSVVQAGDEEDPGEGTPALGHRQQPSSGGHSNSSWHSFLRMNAPRAQVEQHEDLGSAVDFTFVSSNANEPQTADIPSPDPSPTGRGPYSYWSRNQPHQYPPTNTINRRSTDLSSIYPSDSVSNLQLRENLDNQQLQVPAEGEQQTVLIGRPPQGRITPSDRREAERAELRARQEAEARRELAALEVMSPLGTESSIHTEKYSPPPHRSRLPQMPSSDPVMMYPGTVRGNVPHTPGSR